MDELWDGDTGNRIGAYRSERAALADIADTARRYGERSPEATCLGLLGPRGLVANGMELVRRALQDPPRGHPIA